MIGLEARGAPSSVRSLLRESDVRALTAPEINHRSLYDECVGQTQRIADREALLALGDRIEDAGVRYSEAASVGSLAAFFPIALPPHEESLVASLYEKRLLSKAGSGRWAYEKLKSSARHCPFCTFGEVYELDHFLNKATFRELNICPTNLVPICHVCNHIKGTVRPEGPDRYLLHPYFDLLPNIRWLFADMVREAEGPVLTYRIELDTATYGSLARRLKYHFEKLELSRRFSERSANVLVEIESELVEKLELLGAEGVSAHLESEAHRYFRNHGNCLEAAGYMAAASNQEFCSGHMRS